MKKYLNISYYFLSIIIVVNSFSFSQTHLEADPFNLLKIENSQFNGKTPISSNIFRPLFFNSDSILYSFSYRSEAYFNDNSPNQENMDVRYFSKGTGFFNSFQFAINSPYFSFLFEPYSKINNFENVKNISRAGAFSVLNDQQLDSKKIKQSSFRNFLLAFHYKGIGFGWHKGNRWWGPGLHSSFQMTNNTQPFMGNIIGTIEEVKIGRFGFYGLYTFSHLENNNDNDPIYFTSLLGQITWYNSFILSLGFSRNYLTGGKNISNYNWTKDDAKMIVFEGLLTSDLIGNEYTVGGHDYWDQTLSIYGVLAFPKRKLKLYAELGINDNRMYFADFLSQPDHSLSTIFGFRDYGFGSYENLVFGFEWTNMMITYSSRFRPTGNGAWYFREQYNYNSLNGRRWGAHSGTDSDDWFIYAGYLSNKLMIVQGFNYERHGIVSFRPAEVKMESRLDIRYNFNDIWFGIYYEKQLEAFLGFPNYFYQDRSGNKIDASEGRLANTRSTNTIILNISKTINF